ncbi:MAG: hypothetical protein RR128_08775 [Clostridium sp.]
MINNTIKIKDDIYTLRYSMETLCLMTEEGFDPMDFLEGNKLLNLPIVRQLFYYGLLEKHNKPKMTVKKAGEIITNYCNNNGNIYELAEFITRTLADNLGLVVTPDIEESEVEIKEGK